MRKPLSARMQKKLWASSLGIVAVLGTGAAFYFTRANYESINAQSEMRPGLVAAFEGAEPGVSVSYEIVSTAGKSVSGSEKINAHGDLALPAYPMEAADPGSLVVYNLEVERNDKPLRLMLKIDPATGNVSVEGKGLEEFGNITIEGGSSKIETRADWSGIMHEMQTAGLSEGKENSDGLRMAFFDNNILSDAKGQSPLVVKVLTTTGGGGAGPGGVNQSSTTYCGNNPPRMSVCQTPLSSINNDIVSNYVTAFQLMAEQLSAVMLQQMAIIGTFFDAKMQLETQRKLQTLQAQAHKDYHPSDQMCRFGSFVRNIARTEVKAAHDKMGVNEIMMATYRNLKNGNSHIGYISEMDGRLRQFREIYCDPKDNNNGLGYMCQSDFTDPNILTGEALGGIPQRMNKDIDYARNVGSPLTLDVDFTQGTTATADETDVIALAKNLYWPRAFELADPPEAIADDYEPYLEARRHLAQQSVAHNSYASIVGMKSASIPTANPQESGPAFMKSLMREFGLTDPDIENIMGLNPSYYAQMEVLTKKIYQDPDFYTNLYDKPANIDRIGVSMDAIKLMQGRDAYESSLRREMLLSVMLEQEIDQQGRLLSDELTNSVKPTP